MLGRMMQMWLTSESTLIQNSKSSMIEFHSKWMIFSLTFSQDHSIFFILTQESEPITNTHFNIVKYDAIIEITIHGFEGPSWVKTCDHLLNLQAIKCFLEDFKIEDFQNCEILHDKIKAEMIRYCLEQRLIELKNCSDEFDREKRSLDETKVRKKFWK